MKEINIPGFPGIWIVYWKAAMSFCFAPYLFWMNSFVGVSSSVPGNIERIQKIWAGSSSVEQMFIASMEICDVAAKRGQEVQPIIDTIMYYYLIKAEQSCGETSRIAYA